MFGAECYVLPPAWLVRSSGCWGASLINEVRNSRVQACEPQSGLLVTRRSMTGGGMRTCWLCGTRERERERVKCCCVILHPLLCYTCPASVLHWTESDTWRSRMRGSEEDALPTCRLKHVSSEDGLLSCYRIWRKCTVLTSVDPTTLLQSPLARVLLP